MKALSLPLSFVIVGDMHVTANTSGRVSYSTELKNMATQVADFADQVRAYGVGSTGDIMHSKNRATHACTKLAVDVIKRMRGDDGVTRVDTLRPFYTTPGNHDISPGVLSTAAKSPYGVLASAGVIESLASYSDIIETQHGTIIVCGVEHVGNGARAIKHILSKRRTASQRSHSDKPLRGTLAIIHEDIDAAEVLPMVNAHSDSPIVIVNGHIHDKQEVVRKGSVVYARVGVFGRLSRAEADITPMMLHVVFNRTREPVVKLVPLTVETGPGVFRELLPDAKDSPDSSAFIEALRTAAASEADQSWEDIVRAAACKAKVDDGTVRRAIGYLARAEDR